jgi:hypothetical protein
MVWESKSLPGLRSRCSQPFSANGITCVCQNRLLMTRSSRNSFQGPWRKKQKLRLGELASVLSRYSFSLRFRRWRMIVLQAKVRKLTISEVSMSRRDEQVFCCFPLVLFQIVSKLLHVASTCFTNLFSPFLFSFTGSVWVFFSETRLSRHSVMTVGHGAPCKRNVVFCQHPGSLSLRLAWLGGLQYACTGSPWKHSQCTKFGYEKMEPAGSSTQHPSPAYAFGVCTRATHSLGLSGRLGQTEAHLGLRFFGVSSGIFDSTESPQSEHISTYPLVN